LSYLIFWAITALAGFHTGKQAHYHGMTPPNALPVTPVVVTVTGSTLPMMGVG